MKMEVQKPGNTVVVEHNRSVNRITGGNCNRAPFLCYFLFAEKESKESPREEQDDEGFPKDNKMQQITTFREPASSLAVTRIGLSWTKHTKITIFLVSFKRHATL